MCIAIYKPKDKDISRDIFNNCWEDNHDGAGFMYSYENELIIEKGFFRLRHLWANYSKAIKGKAKDKDVVIHFRLATHGKIDNDNCHPHLINKNLAFVHNGIFSEFERSKKISDTMLFNLMILKNLPDDFLDNSGIELLLTYFDSCSKMIFMDNTGKTTIINKDDGIEDNGIWYSNRSYQKTIKTVWDFNTSYYEGDFYKDRRVYDTTEKCEDCKSTLTLIDETETGFCWSCLRSYIEDGFGLEQLKIAREQKG